MNLALEQKQLLANINQTHACTKAPKADGSDGSSDEIDTSRTQRRFNIYLNSVQHFLDYFNESQRLTIVDTSCGKIRFVWEAVRDYVVESNIAQPCQGLDQVIIFGFGESPVTKSKLSFKTLLLKIMAKILMCCSISEGADQCKSAQYMK